MKYLKVLALSIGLVFSFAIFAQEKEVEKPKEAEKATLIKSEPSSGIFRLWSGPRYNVSSG
jgi:hypothetical protein